MPSPALASLSAEEVIAALEGQIEQLTRLADDQALLGMDQEVAETGAMIIKRQNLLYQLRSWIKTRDHNISKRTARVLNFRRHNQIYEEII